MQIRIGNIEPKHKIAVIIVCRKVGEWEETPFSENAQVCNKVDNFRSLSISRKWTPPAMVAHKSDSADIRKSSQLSLGTPGGHSNTRIRVGLSRNYKSPKPLHSSVKWTA